MENIQGIEADFNMCDKAIVSILPTLTKISPVAGKILEESIVKTGRTFLTKTIVSNKIYADFLEFVGFFDNEEHLLTNDGKKYTYALFKNNQSQVAIKPYFQKDTVLYFSEPIDKKIHTFLQVKNVNIERLNELHKKEICGENNYVSIDDVEISSVYNLKKPMRFCLKKIFAKQT